MTKLIRLIVILAFTFSILHGNDHHGHKHHKHSVSKSAIEKQAKKQLALLVKNDKIDKSWMDALVLKVEEKKFGKFTEWVVHFKNEKSKDKSKKLLYMFLNLKGKVLGANYTGN